MTSCRLNALTTELQVCECMFVCVSVCVPAGLYECLCVCVCVLVYVYVPAGVYVCVPAGLYMCVCVRTAEKPHSHTLG